MGPHGVCAAFSFGTTELKSCRPRSAPTRNLTMASTTHPDAFHFHRPVNSYWEASARPLSIECPPLTADTHCDVAIIGAGYTGLHTALALAEDHAMDARILEAGQPGWGASGRNGGFCCLGGAKLTWSEIAKRYGLDEAKRFLSAQIDAVDFVRETCRRFAIDVGAGETGELTLAHKPNRVAELRADLASMKETFGLDGELLSRHDLHSLGASGPEFHAGLRGPHGFGIHPLDYARGLTAAAKSKGVEIHGNSRVVRWEQGTSGHRLTTEAGAVLRARYVVFATNGYTPEDLSPYHRGRLMPALSSIIVTRPLSPSEQQAQGWTTGLLAFDTRNLLHYFRLLPDGRFLFGGRGGTNAANAADGRLEGRLRAHFNALFPAWSGVEHTHFWKGFVCLAYDLVPFVGALDEKRSVWTALAYHGNGVSMASYSGKALAAMIAGHPERVPLSTVMTRRLAPFPLSALRPLYLKGAYAWFDAQDRWL